MSANLSSIFPEFNLNVVKDEKKASYAFEDYRLDAARLMLYRGEKEISLPPKAIETLLVLVANQGTIVGKEDLIGQVWTDTIVEESNLAHYLYVLRKTLGETRDGKPFIETFRRRGYRFNGEVRLLETTPTKNVSAPTAVKISAAPRYEVERRGNVLKLADWREAENPALEIVPDSDAANASAPSKQLSIGKAAIVAAVSVVILASLSFVWFKSLSPTETATNAKSELTFLRLTNGINPIDATISPDGKYFAYHELDDETAHFYVQQTGQSNRLEIIPPSERKIFGKTFSPDGQFIYFLAQDKGEKQFSLYRVPTLGGVQTKILTNIDSPVSFSPDGREMVFHRWNRQTGESALIIAASDGGAERILQARTGGQEVLLYPAWSPDGSQVAFAALYPQGSLPGYYRIAGINLQTDETLALSPENWEACYRMIWTRDGQGLVFVGTKIGEVLSTRRDQIFYLSVPTGEARRLTFDGNRYQLFSLGVTDDDSVIALPDSRLSQIWQMSPDGDSRTAAQITNGLADGKAGIAPLPDGHVGYITRSGENLHVWLMNADGTDQKQLTNDPPFIEELRASPDGSYFVFSANRDRLSHLFRIDADGANLRQLTFREGEGVDSTISPDGNWIVYDSSFFDGGYSKHALWKIPSSGGEPIRVSDANCVTPHFSPDGKLLSCIRNEKEIVIVSAETGAIVKTFETVQPSILNFGAQWTRDGQNLVYRVYRKNVTNLWLQPMSGGSARQLTDFTGNGVHNFAFSTDGSRLYVVRAYQVNDAVLIKNFR